MNAQILTNPSVTRNFVVAPAEELIQADTRDYGFDFDEEELGNELLAPLPVSLAAATIPEVEAEEFEKVFQYFPS